MTALLPSTARRARNLCVRASGRASIASLALFLAAFGVNVCAQDAPTEFTVIPLSAGIHLIRAEVAADPHDRAKGLMFRPHLGANQGMVFLFEAPAVQCMWMKNTLIPLSVAFIGDDGRVLNIAEMQPQTETSHCAAKPARYALEMNLGWFAKHGINAGAKITGLPKPR